VEEGGASLGRSTERKRRKEREGESHQREMHLDEVAGEITAGRRSPEGGADRQKQRVDASRGEK
jgi:hypothetical protein